LHTDQNHSLTTFTRERRLLMLLPIWLQDCNPEPVAFMIHNAHWWHRILANERKTRWPDNAAGAAHCHISVATIVHAICGRWWLQSATIGLTISSYNTRTQFILQQHIAIL